MDPAILVGLALVAFFALVVLGMPIAFAFATVGLIFMSLFRSLEPALLTLGSVPFSWASSYLLVTVPLFILMGQLAFQTGISHDLYAAADKWIGRFPGGLASTTTLSCTLFAACTGSSTAGAATMGVVAFPEMQKFNYNQQFSTGCIAAGGTLGILIPPSILFIVYGCLTETSIAELFIAGILPGILLSILFILMITIRCVINPKLGPRGKSYSWTEMLVSLKGVWGMLTLFLLVIVGLYFGIFTPSEAGSIGAFGAFCIGLATRRLTRSGFVDALKGTLNTTCFMITIFIGAMIFTTFLGMTGVPNSFGSFIVNLHVSRYVILILLLLMYIPLGMVMDAMPMVLLTIPFIFPVLMQLGFDSVWFGVLLCLMCELACISPPVGLNAYVVHGVCNVPLEDVFRGSAPFIFVIILVVAILVAFPQIVLFLPSMMK